MAFGYDGSVRIKADLNHSPFDRGLSSMTKQVNAFGGTLRKIGGMVAMAFGTAALINFGKESIKLASDIEEVQNVIDVTFGNGAAQIEEFARSAAEAYGLSELAAKQYTGTMGAMLKSSGLATAEAQEMSVALAGLAGDMASFYNLDTDEAFQKIRAGISGETEPLKQLGVNMSVANLEAYALSQGITKSYNAMSQAEQVLLRYNYLLSITTDAQGDFARTSGSFANQIRILQLNFDQLKIAVGNAIIPIAQAVLPGINAIISALTKLATVFSQVTALLFGKSAQVKATSGIATSAGAAADATDRLAESTAGAGSAAKQAAKDLKGVLAGFDELNILATSAADSTSGGAGGGIDTSIPEIPSFESEIEETGQLEDAFSSLGELFIKTLDDMIAAIPGLRDALLGFAADFNEFNQKLYDAFTFPGVLERVKQLGHDLAAALNDFVLAIDWDLWGRTLGAGLNLGLNFLTSFLYEFDWITLGESLASFINGLVYEVDWYEFGRLMWAQFKIALETFAGFILGLDMPELAQAASNIIMGFFDSMKETIANIEWGEIGRQIAEFLNNIDWGGVINSIAGAIGEMIPAALDLIGGFIDNADPDTLLVAALFLGTKLLGGLVSKVLGPIAKEIAGNLIKNIAGAITGGETGGLLASIGSAFSGIASAVGPVLAVIGKISLVVGGALMAVINFIKMLTDGFSWLNEILMVVGVALAAVGAVILGAPAAVAAAIAGIVASVATVIVVIKEHWEEIGEFFSQLFENILNWASETLDGIFEYWSGVGEWWSENVITPITEFFTQLGEDISTWANETITNIQEFWSGVGAWFDENVCRPVGKFFSDLWDGIKQTASDLWDNIVGIWEGASTWFEEHVTDPLGKAFEAAAEFIKSVINGIISTVEGMVNAVIKAINWLITQLNKLKIDIPDNPITGALSIGFNIPSISEIQLPRLANGTVIPPNQQFAAILGDQRSGVNVETPLKTIEQALENVMARNGGFGGDANITVESVLDGKVIARNTVRHINSMTRSAGKPVLLI